MKKNEFGEIEKSFSKVNFLIIAVAVIAITITGSMVSKNISSSGIDSGCVTSTSANV